MNKYAATLLLLVSAPSTHAVDSFDANTQTLTIPSVMVGVTAYNNVTLKLNNFTVLAYDQNPLAGIVIYEDGRIKIEMMRSSRSGGDVVFSLLAINKTASRLLIAGNSDTSIQSAMSDEKGSVCSSLYLSGINEVNLKNNTDITKYSIIFPGDQNVFGVHSSACFFQGNIFNYYDHLWIYDETTSTVAPVLFGFNGFAIPK